jgi:hypothetical protein
LALTKWYTEKFGINMIDFTKEELEEIFYLIDDYQGMHGEFGRFNLYEKIKSMIDNYCEHKTHVIFSGDMLICDNCKERI